MVQMLMWVQTCEKIPILETVIVQLTSGQIKSGHVNVQTLFSHAHHAPYLLSWSIRLSAMLYVCYTRFYMSHVHCVSAPTHDQIEHSCRVIYSIFHLSEHWLTKWIHLDNIKKHITVELRDWTLFRFIVHIQPQNSSFASCHFLLWCPVGFQRSWWESGRNCCSVVFHFTSQ